MIIPSGYGSTTEKFISLRYHRFKGLDLHRMNSIVSRQFLVFSGVPADVPFLRADVKKAVVEIPIANRRILLKKIFEIPLGRVVRCGEVSGKKNIDGQGLRKRGDDLLGRI